MTPNHRASFVNMSSSLLGRRGPDSFGSASFSSGNTGIEFVHTRLSIIDLSDTANQPFYSDDEEIVLVFNGEIYNYLELKDQIGSGKYRTSSDTEVLLKAYQQYGLEMVNHFEGMFAGAIYDKKAQMVHFFRDHMGIKPFYYYLSEEGLMFSSEPKVIRNAVPSVNKVNNRQAATFLLFGLSDFSDETFFDGVNQLKPGHTLTLDLNTFKTSISRYFHPNKAEQVDFPNTPEGYRELFSDAVNRQLRSDVQVGTSLSGGIDSGIIAIAVGELQKAKSDIKALTYVAPGFEHDESEFASQIAKKSGLDWKPVQFTSDNFLEDFQSLINYMEEPFGSLSIFAQFNIMKAAKREGCKVMLDGQGGDELYIGYPRLAQRIILQNLMDYKFGSMLSEWFWAIKRQEMSLLYPVLSNLYFNSFRMVTAKKLASFSRYVDKEYLLGFDEESVADFYSLKGIQAKQVDELHRFILPRLLKYADRNSMFHSVESRVPHLAQRLVNFSLSLEPEKKVYKGWTKYIMRKAFEDKMPHEVIWQTKKIGFDTPQGEWLAKIRPFVESEVDSLGGVINRNALLDDLKNENKASNHGLFRVLSFVLSIKSQNLSLG